MWVLGHNGVWNTFRCRRLAIPRSTQGLLSVRWKYFCFNSEMLKTAFVWVWERLAGCWKTNLVYKKGINTRDFTDRGAIIKYLIMRMSSVAQWRKIDGEPECWLSWMSSTVHYISQEPCSSLWFVPSSFNAYGLIMKHLNNKILCVTTLEYFWMHNCITDKWQWHILTFTVSP